jgi:mono/diheme cytochrome c family protein
MMDAEMVQAGARAFSQRGCAICHGAPVEAAEQEDRGADHRAPVVRARLKERSCVVL